MICDECGEECSGYVCKYCGLVSEEKELVSLIPKQRDEPTALQVSWSHPLSPSLEFQKYRPNKSANFELNKALRRQNRKLKKGKDEYYVRVHGDIKARCNQLRLPRVVLSECFNIARLLIDVKKTYFMHSRADYRHLAIIRIACKINDVYVDERELVRVSRYYDGKPINMRNSPIKKNIDRESMIIKRELHLRIKRPDLPNFLAHACHVLGIEQEDETRLYNLYSKIKHRFAPRFKLEGYLLALIYNCCKKYKIGLGKLETAFGVARDTIRSRKKEIEGFIR